MRTYETLIIFADTVNEENMSDALKAFQTEVEKQGGEVKDCVPMGRRMFARPMKKRDSGSYAKVFMTMAPDKVVALKQRCKFVDVLFRMQITLLPKGFKRPAEQSENVKAAETAAAPLKKEADDGIDE